MSNFLDDCLRRLPSLLHLVMTILSVPYVLLAVMLVLVGHVFSSRGVWAFLNTLLDSLNWTLTWGLLTLGATLLTIIGLGFFESLRWWAALALAVLLLASLGIIFYHFPSLPTWDELVLLTPAILVLLICCRQLILYWPR